MILPQLRTGIVGTTLVINPERYPLPTYSGPAWERPTTGPLTGLPVTQPYVPQYPVGGPAGAGPGWEQGVGGQQNLSGCDLWPEQWQKDLCKGIVTVVKDKFGNPVTPTQPLQPTPPCPDGYARNAAGVCQLQGMAPYIPGDVGRPDYVWTAINGRYGAGVTPVLVQRNVRDCPPSFVLGKDGVCYDHLARTARMHNPGAKPLLTGGDMNALRKVKRLEKRWAKAAPAFQKKVVSRGARLMKPPKRR